MANALSPYGTIETFRRQRVLVLQSPSMTLARKAQSTLADLESSGLIEFVTPVLTDPESNTRQVLTDEIVLRLKPGRAHHALAALKAKHGITVARRNRFEPSQYIVKVSQPSGMQTLNVARSLDRSDDVEFASPNFLTGFKR